MFLLCPFFFFYCFVFLVIMEGSSRNFCYVMRMNCGDGRCVEDSAALLALLHLLRRVLELTAETVRLLRESSAELKRLVRSPESIRVSACLPGAQLVPPCLPLSSIPDTRRARNPVRHPQNRWLGLWPSLGRSGVLAAGRCG